MNVSKRFTLSTGIFGCFIIVLAIGCIVAGIVAMTEVSDDVSSIGLWAIYVSFNIGKILLKPTISKNK